MRRRGRWVRRGSAGGEVLPSNGAARARIRENNQGSRITPGADDFSYSGIKPSNLSHI